MRLHGSDWRKRPARVQRLCQRTRHAIIDRLIDLAPELQDETVTAEREALEIASRKLTLHERAHEAK